MRRAPLVLALLLGCSNPGEAPGKAAEAKPDATKPDATKPDATKPDTTKPDATKPDAPKPDAPVAPPDTPPAGPPGFTLIVGDDEGLHEYDLDGKRLATLVQGPATMPRVLPDGRIAFLRDQAGQLSLWMHAPGSPAKSIATLPRHLDTKACRATDEASGIELDVQAPGDFRVDPAKQEACMRIQDRNDNMAEFGVALTVSLQDGALRQSIYETSEDSSCELPEGAGDACLDLPWLPEPPKPDTATSFPFNFDDAEHTLAGPEGEPQRLCAGEDMCASVESKSASGRFVLLSGQISEGDYIYRDLIVLDRQDGTLWVVGGEPEALVAVTPAQLFDEHDEWFAAAGESDVRWLPDDHLWLDGRLIDAAARKLVAIGGSLAVRP